VRPALRRHASLQYPSSPSGSTLLQVRHREILDMDAMSSPAAALTACTTSEHRASVMPAGFQYHVGKPVGVRELIDIVAVLALKEDAPRA